MKAAEIEPILASWMAEQRALENALEPLYTALGADAGSPVMDSIYQVMTAHTRAIARIVGDEDGWLEWFSNETEWGARDLGARINDKIVKVRTIKQLASAVAKR